MDDSPPELTPEESSGANSFTLHLTPAQMKITHTALKSLLDDFGHEEADVHRLIHEVLEKLPDDTTMRAIRIED